MLRATATALSFAALLAIGCDSTDFDSPTDPMNTPGGTEDVYSPTDPPVQPDFTAPADPPPGTAPTPFDATPDAGLETSDTGRAPASPPGVEAPAVEEVPAD